jgi:hypothetical protein
MAKYQTLSKAEFLGEIDRLIGDWKKHGKWSDTPADIDRTFSFSELLAESDRGCLLSGCAFIDSLLEENIRRKFHELSGVTKKELDPLLSVGAIPPMRPFGIRIQVAAALGIIDRNTRFTLKAMQDLRNANAHSWMTFKFTKSNVSSITTQLGRDTEKMITKNAVFIDQIAERLAEPFTSPHSLETWTFLWTIALLINRLLPHK